VFPGPRLILGSSRLFQALLQGSIAYTEALQWTRLASLGSHGVQMPYSLATFESGLRRVKAHVKAMIISAFPARGFV
jgi:hypothetical protein